MYNPDDPQIDEFDDSYESYNDDYEDEICNECGEFIDECLCFDDLYDDDVDLEQEQSDFAHDDNFYNRDCEDSLND